MVDCQLGLCGGVSVELRVVNGSKAGCVLRRGPGYLRFERWWLRDKVAWELPKPNNETFGSDRRSHVL
jgi:hypothetical protein